MLFFVNTGIIRSFQYIRNRRNGINLLHQGYTYRRKANNSKTTNWVCSQSAIQDAQMRWISCPARCIVTSIGGIKLSGKQHNHSPPGLSKLDVNQSDANQLAENKKLKEKIKKQKQTNKKL